MLMFSLSAIQAQTITYRFANVAINGTSVEFDVTLESSTSFELGSGQIYINYNTAAFGTSAVAAGRVTITHPYGPTLLGSGYYSTFITNDNTDSRFSFSWQQLYSSGTIPSNNITATAAVLFHVKMDFTAGGSGQPQNICFEASGIYDDQTFTACGPYTVPGPPFFADPANCTSFPGTQILDDNFNCSFAVLPLELSIFTARPLTTTDAQLNWTTDSEINTSHFEVERSIDGKVWEKFETVAAAGFSQEERRYQLVDAKVFNPAELAKATFYYRLRMVDLDGSFEYSPVRSVAFEGGRFFVGEPYPNPASRDGAFIQLPVFMQEDVSLEMVVYDVAGSVVGIFQQEAGLGQQLVSLKLGRLAAGVYHLKVTAGREVFTKKLVVQ